MVEKTQSEVDVVGLKRKIRREIYRRQLLKRTSLSEEGIDSILEECYVPYRESDIRSFNKKATRYKLNDFIRFSGEEFITNVYLGLLKREPDIESLTSYLERLDASKLDKITMMMSIRFSAEGRANNIKVSGLVWRYGLLQLRRIPVIGYCIGLVADLLFLPSTIRHLAVVENEIMRLHNRAEQCITKLMDMRMREQVQLMVLSEENCKLREQLFCPKQYSKSEEV